MLVIIHYLSSPRRYRGDWGQLEGDLEVMTAKVMTGKKRQEKEGEHPMAKILCVLTGASYWTLKDGHRHPTGYWAEEFVAPYSLFTGAGHEVTVATPGGVVPVVDTMSLEPRMAGGEKNSLGEEAVIEKADELRHPISLKEVRLDDYDAVYYPGGHGPMEDLSVDPDSGSLLRTALASGNPLGIVCHAPAALLATRDANGNTPFANYRVTVSETKRRSASVSPARPSSC